MTRPKGFSELSVWLALALYLLPLAGLAQQIENIKATARGTQVIITYDVAGTFTSETLFVTIFASHDGFARPLHRISGDVGQGVVPGKGKTIYWEAKEELGDFKGDLVFEIRADIIAVLSYQNDWTSVRRGTTTRIQWKGGDKHQDIRIELLQGGALLEDLGSVANNGSFEWAVPITQAPGSGYQIRVTDGAEQTLSHPFHVRRKIPLVLKALPIVGAGIFLLLPSGNSSDNQLPAPPDVGLN